MFGVSLLWKPHLFNVATLLDLNKIDKKITVFVSQTRVVATPSDFQEVLYFAESEVQYHEREHQNVSTKYSE